MTLSFFFLFFWSLYVSIVGPILLQTLKRLDKSQSILLFRNTQTTGTTTCTLTTASPNIVKTTSVGNHIAVIANKDDDKMESKPKTKTVSMNVPLGAGKYTFGHFFFLSFVPSRPDKIVVTKCACKYVKVKILWVSW